MKKLIIGICLSLFWILGIAVTNINAQTAYGISIVRYNTDTRIVDGYSGTWLDYYAGLYYDPEVIGDLYRADMNETSLDHGRHVGYADIVPAEVYLSTTNFVEGRTYCTHSQHAVWGYFYYQQTGQWFDPFRYSTFIGNLPPWPGFPFSYYYVFPRRYYLGYTQVCIAIPTPPPPTPTPPPPTPTPTPTPCPGTLSPEGVCQVPRVEVDVNPAPLRPSSTTGGTNTSNVRTCIFNVNNPGGRAVRLALSNVSSSTQLDAGHKEDFHTGTRPLGKLAKTTGTTNSNGCFSTTYSPSHISGQIQVISTIFGSVIGGTRGSRNFGVLFPGLHILNPGGDYRLIGSTDAHPSNHWGTSSAVGDLPLIASDYKTEFYGNNPIPEDEKVAYNDMSLEWGGKFDLGRSWLNSKAHAEHREGINCDTRSSNIPRGRWARLNEFFRNRGSTSTNDETGGDAPHWHLRFLYGAPHVAAERTPHIFVEDVFGAVSGRESTQEEYEEWLARITNAKATGQSELLFEAKNFIVTTFASNGYGGRQLSDEEFIQKVFWAHVFREPAVEETQMWLDYLHNLPPALPRDRKKRRLIEEFQLSTEFQDIVFGIVDAPPPSQ